MAPFNKTKKFGKPAFSRPDSRGPRKFGAGPRPSGGPKRFGGGGTYRRPEGGDFERPRFEKQLFKATCAACGKPCDLPFKPSGERPVYCRDCFQRQDHDSQPQAWHQRIRTSDYSGERKPRDFRNERLEPRPAEPQLAQELAGINAKLDRIIKALTAAPAAAEPKPAAVKRPRRKAAAVEDAGPDADGAEEQQEG
ncbi:MAG: hypothetical protein MUF78_00010 [Candidatus Edwardsbacteria bacterium]|jgi:CxxC-x17-CxxC domain-containing protein|nr:hypothetical protein [Candidatus Edwardsbacteria bacterium]